MRLRTLAMFLALLTLTAAPVHARYRPGLTWRTMSAGRFVVYYPEGHEAFARRVLSLGGEVESDVTGWLGVTPPRAVIVINPDTDLFNGFYAPFPNRIGLYETPLADLKTFGHTTADLADLVFTHEYTHLVHITMRRGWYGALTRVIGPGLALTNALSPGWIIEGVTTNAETAFTTGGRGRSPLFRATMTDYARKDRLWGLSAAGTPSAYAPPGGRFYHAGLFMVEYLDTRWGQDAFPKLARRQASRPFRFSGKALSHVTGISPREFYRDFSVHIHTLADSAEQAADSIGLPRGDKVYGGWPDGVSAHTWMPDGTMLAVKNGFDTPGAFVEVSPSGALTAEYPRGIYVGRGPVRTFGDGDLLIARPYYHPLGDLSIDTLDLARLDPKTLTYTRLTTGAHIFSADIAPDGSRIVVVRRAGMWMELVTMDSDGSNIRPLAAYDGWYFENPAFSPDGRTVAVAVKTGENTDIALVDVTTGAVETLFGTDPDGDGDPCFSPDGRWLAFTSTRGGTWDIYAFDLRDRRLFRLTSVVTAATEPRISPDGRTLSFLVHSLGTAELRSMPFRPEDGREVPCGQPGPVPEPDLARLQPDTPRVSADIPLRDRLLPFVHGPYVAGDDKGTAGGLYLMGGDPVEHFAYNGSLLYGFESKRPGYDVTVTNASLWPTISLHAYDITLRDNLLDGTEFDYREHGGELTVSQPVIHRISPSALASGITAGMSVRRYSSLEDGIRINPDYDTRVSLLGGYTFQHITDSAARDMMPGRGQVFSVIREEHLDTLGGELPGKTTLAMARQYIPSPIGHHGLELSVYHQRQSGMMRADSRAAIPRGYDDNDEVGGFTGSRVMTVSAEYRFPFRYVDRGLGLSLLHANRLAGSLFVDHGAGWNGAFDSGRWARDVRTTVGGTVTVGGYVSGMLPVQAGIAGGWRVRERDWFTRFIIGVDMESLNQREMFTASPLDNVARWLGKDVWGRW